MLLSDRLVLTCAHVVKQMGTDKPEERIGIEFIGLPGRQSGVASVVADGWFPERPDQCGDIALLELDCPVPERVSVPLRNMSLRDKDVKAQGYPHGAQVRSEWAELRAVGPGGPNDEWVQLVPRSPVGPRVRRGFSGAGVLDEATNDVVGIVVAAWTTEKSDASYMIPMDTVAAYLPPMASLVAGDAATDRGLVDIAERRLVEVSGGREDTDDTRVRQTVRVVSGWLRPTAPSMAGNVVGPAGAERSAALATVVSLADPVSRKRLPADVVSTVPPELILPTRSVDLAIDATGQTTEQVAVRIAERIGLDTTGADLVARVVPAAAALFLVVDSVDDAATPESLQKNLLGPIAAAAPRCGGKLVLGSRAELLPGVAIMYVDGTATERLDRLEIAIADVDAAERSARMRYAEVALRIANTPKPSTRSAELSIVAYVLRAAARIDEAMLAKAERAAARHLREARDLVSQLDALLNRRDQLRGLLDAYRTRAAGPLVEDAELSRLYRAARDALWRAPCDLDDAQAAVDSYLDAVRRRLAEGREQ